MKIIASQINSKWTVSLAANLSWHPIIHQCFCEGNPPVTGGFYSRRDSNADFHVMTLPRSYNFGENNAKPLSSPLLTCCWSYSSEQTLKLEYEIWLNRHTNLSLMKMHSRIMSVIGQPFCFRPNVSMQSPRCQFSNILLVFTYNCKFLPQVPLGHNRKFPWRYATIRILHFCGNVNHRLKLFYLQRKCQSKFETFLFSGTLF